MGMDTTLHHREISRKAYTKPELIARKKRQQRRFVDRCKVEFTVDGKTYRGLSSNFSLNGLFIRTKQIFQSEALADICVYLPNDLQSYLKGKVIRLSKNGPWCKNEAYAENGIGIEIINKDATYLHFIRSLLT
jgi:hypothetical protein